MSFKNLFGVIMAVFVVIFVFCVVATLSYLFGYFIGWLIMKISGVTILGGVYLPKLLGILNVILVLLFGSRR